MRTFSRLLTFSLALGAAASAHAQAPDIRSIRPVVMLLVDSSGSMEYKLTTPDTTSTPNYCYDGTNACMPTCTATPGADERNRWAIVLEALTGTYNNFSCEPHLGSTPSVDYRDASYVNPITGNTIDFAASYDYRFDLPHNQINFTSQQNDGILDTYVDRVKFGLMTFDGQPTLAQMSMTILDTNTAVINQYPTLPGGFSYGPNKALNYDNCPGDYILNVGSKRAEASSTEDVDGALISVGGESSSPNYYDLINESIQNELLSTRPFGGTPIAGMLDDFRYYLANHEDVRQPSGGSGDPFFLCRPRYALLLTDGVPDGDFRDPTKQMYCVGSEADNKCPYDRAEDIAADLCGFNSSTLECGNHNNPTGGIDGLFVVGLAIDNASSKVVLDDIARTGGTCADCATGQAAPASGDHYAFFADDLASLRSSLSEALDQAAQSAVTRTVPAFANSSGTSGTQQQLQFSTGFIVKGGGRPWVGLLERTRYVCNPTTLVPEAATSVAEDAFHDVLSGTNGNAPPNRGHTRRLLTVEPTLNAEEAWYTGDSYASLPAVASLLGSPYQASSALPFSPEDTNKQMVLISAITPTVVPKEVFGAADDNEREDIIHWLYGESTLREDQRMGDVYYSSPVVVGPPRTDIADESFNYFRNDVTVAGRPTMVYVGTNDGILHAFVAADHTYPSAGTPYSGQTREAGTELWGFVPPALLDDVKSTMTAHRSMFDGSPLVKDVYLRRQPGQPAAPEQYRTILVSPIGGEAAYIALDVTDPEDPKFLWQFTLPAYFGRTIGQPAITQILVKAASGGSVEERAVAVLPAGDGSIDPAAAGTLNGTGCAFAHSVAARVGTPTQPGGQPSGIDSIGVGNCWQANKGRAVAMVDIATGKLIALLSEDTGWGIDEPLTGSVSVFPGGTSLVSTRGFTTGEDGRTYRLDWTNPDPDQWRADVFFDSFHAASSPSERQPGRYAPAIATDEEGHVVVVQATGDIMSLETASNNYVFSATEVLKGCAGGTCTDWEMRFNWELLLDHGGQVTGPIELFDSNVYFASFHSRVNPQDACQFGESYIWSAHYRKQDPGSGTPYAPLGGFENTPGVFDLHDTAITNQIVMGVSITQRPICYTGTSVNDPYFPSQQRFSPGNSGGGNFALVYQASGNQAGQYGRVTVNQRPLTPPRMVTRASGFAGSAD